MKRLICFAMAFIIGGAGAVYAAKTPAVDTAAFVGSKVVFDGNTLDLSRDPLVGISLPGERSMRHYMPVESVLEQMGYIVNFDDKRRVVSVTTPGSAPPKHLDSISSTGAFANGGIRGAAFNDYTVNVNGVNVDLYDDKLITVLRGTEAHPQFYMPLRAVLEHMGYYIAWDSVESAVIIASEDYYNRFGVEFMPEAEPEEAAEDGETGETGEDGSLTGEALESDSQAAAAIDGVSDGQEAAAIDDASSNQAAATPVSESETHADGASANVNKIEKPIIPDDVGDYITDGRPIPRTDFSSHIHLDPVTNGEFVITGPIATPEPHYISLDEEVAEAVSILAAGLHDPESLVIRSIRFVGDYTDGFAIYFEFASRNKLDGYVARVAEVAVDGTLIIVDETKIEGVDDPSQIYTDIRIAFQNAEVYAQY
jgi:hypothetical protein